MLGANGIGRLGTYHVITVQVIIKPQLFKPVRSKGKCPWLSPAPHYNILTVATSPKLPLYDLINKSLRLCCMCV